MALLKIRKEECNAVCADCNAHGVYDLRAAPHSFLLVRLCGGEEEEMEVTGLSSQLCVCTDPDWVLMELGAFICIECAAVHRRLGSTISQVRSIQLDAWGAQQVEV